MSGGDYVRRSIAVPRARLLEDIFVGRADLAAVFGDVESELRYFRLAARARDAGDSYVIRRDLCSSFISDSVRPVDFSGVRGR